MEKQQDLIQFTLQNAGKRSAEAALAVSELTKPVMNVLAQKAVIFTYHTISEKPVFRPFLRLIGPAYGKAMGYNTKGEDGNRTITH